MNNKQPAVKLDNEQLSKLHEIFRSFDRNNDGSLMKLELDSLLQSLGLKPRPDQIDALIQKVDTTNNGLVKFFEFVVVAPELPEEQLRHLFKMFDWDGNGFITTAKLGADRDD